MTDDPVEAWAEHLGERWREAMRAPLEAHRAELPFPEDIREHHRFDLHPERPFPSDRFPAPDRWMWEGEEEPCEARFEHLHDGWIPLRDHGCGEYGILVVTGGEAGRLWVLSDVGVARHDPYFGLVMGIGSGIVRVHVRRAGLVHNVDIEPGDARKAYDVRVRTFPAGRHRHVRTTEHGAVPAKRLGTLLG